ncbi:hypothetical protein JD77_05628 [Micromonospora olivasterospora]|uniref:Glyoxalase-like domain-containing protein n=1 Tax=Micromonospora olivasterospora TaxID=1880 RepID=A0A562IIT2_MICOL|nr:hypothetical protein JD77_05628 [Micromonospora olivasterospora]
MSSSCSGASGSNRSGQRADCSAVVNATHPDPSAVRRDLAALGVHLDVTAGSPAGLEAVLDSPRGPVTLR